MSVAMTSLLVLVLGLALANVYDVILCNSVQAMTDRSVLFCFISRLFRPPRGKDMQREPARIVCLSIRCSHIVPANMAHAWLFERWYY